jgi:endonuclease YncB( thermonuclease family)
MKLFKISAVITALTLVTLPVKADVIIKVYDGDTVTTASNEKIRLACIDAPEMKNNKHGKKDPIGGPAAQKWLSDLVLNKDIRIERITTDLYGRTVGRLFLADGTEVNQQAVAMGHAVVYMPKACSWAQK